MTEFFQARALQYEIQVLVDGRWRIDEIVTGNGELDHRTFAALEASAIERAKAMLGSDGIAAVKVVRERRRSDGFATSREIFSQDGAPPPKEAPLTLGRLHRTTSPVAPACAALPDLYRRDACRIISTLLRSFLDRLSVTPLELLHYAPYARKLEDNWGLVSAAASQVGQLQATGADAASAAHRAERLKELIDQAIRKAREAEGRRRLPVFGGDFQAWSQAIAALVGEDERAYYLQVAMARHLAGLPGYVGRLDFALPGVEQPVGETVRAELDAFIAGCLESPQLLMDLIGPQANLAAVLLALAALAEGHFDGRDAPEPTLRLQAQLARGALPQSLPVLWERIVRELGKPNPLSRRDPGQEWTLLMKLGDELPQRAPEGWRGAIAAALGDRARQAREALP